MDMLFLFTTLDWLLSKFINVNRKTENHSYLQGRPLFRGNFAKITHKSLGRTLYAGAVTPIVFLWRKGFTLIQTCRCLGCLFHFRWIAPLFKLARNGEGLQRFEEDVSAFYYGYMNFCWGLDWVSVQFFRRKRAHSTKCPCCYSSEDEPENHASTKKEVGWFAICFCRNIRSMIGQSRRWVAVFEEGLDSNKNSTAKVFRRHICCEFIHRDHVTTAEERNQR